MKRKGRKLRVDEAQLKFFFIKYSTTCKNRNIKYNDPIFSTISEEIKHVMSPLALYSWHKRNYCKIFGSDYNDDNTITESSLSSPSCLSSASSTTKYELNKNQTKQFSFLLDDHEWKKVEPISVRYVRRDLKTTSTHKKYKTLPKFKWSSLLKEKIWHYSRRPCTWTFKNKFIDSENNVKIKGKCSQCSCSVEISSEKTTDKTATIKCTIFNADNLVPHNPKFKSKMTPYKRNQLAKKLQYKPAAVVHKEIASKIIKDEDNLIPPILPTMEALRKIKYEKRQSNRLHPNPILSTLMMSISSIYQNFIREITLVPAFYIYYWSEQQIQFYKRYFEKFAQNVTITIDATGSFFRPIKLPDGSILSKRLFLHVGMLTSRTIKTQAIFQMISDTHTAESISSWLKRWIREIRIGPKEIITDDSSALIAANVDAFTTYKTVKNYLRQSFLVLRKLSSNLPEVFLRLDTSHFVKNIYDLPCFQNVDIPIKMFFIRCILFIKRSENFDDIKNMTSDVIKICTYKYDYVTNKACETAMKNIRKKLLEMKDPVLENSEKETFDHDTSIIDEDNILDWLDEIVQQQKELCQAPTENLSKYYLPNLISTLRRLLIKLPLWSNVMCPLYDTQNKSPSSSSVESYFKTLKHLLFETRIQKYNIDEFLNIHYNFLQGETKVNLNSLDGIAQNYTLNCEGHKRKSRRLKTSTIKKKKNAEVTFTSDSIFAEQPSYTENWKGEGYEVQNITSSSILFLKNGNIVDSKKNVSNTCAFDSVFFMLAYGYQTNIYIRELFNFCKNKLIFDLIYILANNQNEKEAYKLREEIISHYYEKKDNYYECNSNMAFVFEHLLFDFLYSVKRTKECMTSICGDYEKKICRFVVFLSLNLDIINIFGIKSLEDAIVIDNSELKTCSECKNKSIQYKYELNNIALFDLNGTQNIILSDIPRYIKTGRKTFKLIGALEYVPPCVGNIGHYKSHCLISDNWVCYDDNKNKVHESSVQPITLHNVT